MWLRRIAAERFFSFWAKSVAEVEKRLVWAKKKQKQKDKDVHAPLWALGVSTNINFFLTDVFRLARRICRNGGTARNVVLYRQLR